MSKEKVNAVENKEVVATAATTNAVVTAPKGNYITLMLEGAKSRFMEANAGLDLDFVRMGQFLKLNKKGNFVLHTDDTVSFGDSIDVVIASGEQRHTLWGAKDSPEENEIICMEKTYEEAVEKLEKFLEYTPGASERYSVGDIKLRYLAYVVFTDDLGGEDLPDVYLINMAQGDAFGFGNHAKAVFSGDKAKNVPKGCGVATVVSRLTSEERKVKDSSDTYLGIKFEIVGPFIPSEYTKA